MNMFKDALQKQLEIHMPSEGGPNAKIKVLPTLKRGSEEEFEWSELARLVLEAEIQDNIQNRIREERNRSRREAALSSGKDWDPTEDDLVDSRQHMKALSYRMGCHLDDLQAVKAGISEQEWETKRWERLVRIESTRDKLKSWSELEALAVQALMHRIETGRIVDENVLLAIANTAARVTQMGNSSSGGPNSSGAASLNVGVQINTIGSTPGGDLPGPGNLGPITLTLSNRVVTQLKKNRSDEDAGFLDSIEMMGVKDVPGLIKTIDGEAIKDDS